MVIAKTKQNFEPTSGIFNYKTQPKLIKSKYLASKLQIFKKDQNSLCVISDAEKQQTPYLAIALPPLLGLRLVLGHGRPRLLLQECYLPLMVLDQAVLLSIVKLELVRPLLFVLQLQLHNLIGQQERDFNSSTSLSS